MSEEYALHSVCIARAVRVTCFLQLQLQCGCLAFSGCDKAPLRVRNRKASGSAGGYLLLAAAKRPIKEARHDLVQLAGLRKFRVVPETVIEPIEDHKPRMHARAQKSAVQNCRVAEEHVAGAGHEQRGRHAVQIREER
jgi:hypothetical protein